MSDEPKRDNSQPYPEIAREEAERLAKSDPAIAALLHRNIPVTRSSYLLRAWGGYPPEPWTAEHEANVPSCFHDPDAVPQGVAFPD